MSKRYVVTNEQIFKAKNDQRKVFAKEPFEKKVEAIIQLQHMNLELKKASGRLHLAFRPWDMSEEEYKRFIES